MGQFRYIGIYCRVLLSAYLVFDLLKNIDKESVHKQLVGIVSEKIAGWVLTIFGILFIFRAIGIIAQAFMDQMPLPLSELGVLVADIVFSALWVVGGIFLLRQKPLGYVSGLGLLFAASMLFVSLIIFLLIQPVLTNEPFVLTDVVAVLIMGLICFVPSDSFCAVLYPKDNSITEPEISISNGKKIVDVETPDLRWKNLYRARFAACIAIPVSIALELLSAMFIARNIIQNHFSLCALPGTTR